MNILEEIFIYKKKELGELVNQYSREEIINLGNQFPAPINFKEALSSQTSDIPNLIAEIKYKSPSKGVLIPNFEPLKLAETYAKNGASAISVLTDDKFFGGSLKILKDVHDLGLKIPLLRKDFIFDKYQLLEAKQSGASAILLIVAMLTDNQLFELIAIARELFLTPLVEIHNEEELSRAVSAGADVIGINNRDLRTFEVSLETSLSLSKLSPPDVILVAESGIHTKEDVQKLSEAKFNAILVGESLVTSSDVAGKVRSLSGIHE